MQVTVSTNWLAQNLGKKHLVILDASWYLPDINRNGFKEYQIRHIEGAQFFDIDAISDQNTDLPHMMPDQDLFTSAAQGFGINADSTIIIYDGMGIFSAARVWWMFKTMGHKSVYVLDGGLPAWLSQGHDVTNAISPTKQGDFSALLDKHAIKSAEQVSDSTDHILDARPKARFDGDVAEPRAGLRSGHIPGSTSLFFKSLLTDKGFLKPDAELQTTFQNAGIDISKPIITSCGSGVTAAILTLALCRLDAPELSLYDGSWADWGARTDLPIATT